MIIKNLYIGFDVSFKSYISNIYFQEIFQSETFCVAFKLLIIDMKIHKPKYCLELNDEEKIRKNNDLDELKINSICQDDRGGSQTQFQA